MAFTPSVRRDRAQRAKTLGYFISGLLLGGACVGTLLWLASGLVQPMPHSARQLVVIAVVLLALLHDWGLLTFALPQRQHQVPRETVRDAGPFAMVRFGFELGVGFRTFVTAAVPYALAVAVTLLIQDAVAAIAVGLCFGLGRALLAVVRYAQYGQADPEGGGWKSMRSVKRYCATAAAASAAILLV